MGVSSLFVILVWPEALSTIASKPEHDKVIGALRRRAWKGNPALNHRAGIAIVMI
jgi:hypothetical protein